MNRGDRLNERFKLIQQSLFELYGAEAAFGAASAAWLMAIQYAAKQSILRLEKEYSQMFGKLGYSDALIDELEGELELLLRSFHKELCQHLGVSPAIAERHAKAFKQVVEDICNQGG